MRVTLGAAAGTSVAVLGEGARGSLAELLVPAGPRAPGVLRGSGGGLDSASRRAAGGGWDWSREARRGAGGAQV